MSDTDRVRALREHNDKHVRANWLGSGKVPIMIDADIARLLEGRNARLREQSNSEPLTVGDHRAGMQRMAAMFAPEPRIELDSVVDSTIPGPGGGAPVRTYRATNQPTGVVMFFHGGGWITGGFDSHDFIVRKLAHETGFGFVAVDYGLAPEHPFPAGLEDCTTAATWVDDHVEDFGGIKGQLAVAGDGAGGNLAAVVARKFRDTGRHLTAQLLLYPITDSVGHYRSRHDYAEGYWITTDDIAVSTQLYLGNNPTMVSAEDVAPIRATNLSGLAPAVIGVAHADPYRDEGLAYANALAAAGVDVFVSDYQGMIHNFASMFAISDGANRALTNVLDQFSKKMVA
jgi:acetyl esterase